MKGLLNFETKIRAPKSVISFPSTIPDSVRHCDPEEMSTLVVFLQVPAQDVGPAAVAPGFAPAKAMPHLGQVHKSTQNYAQIAHFGRRERKRRFGELLFFSNSS